MLSIEEVRTKITLGKRLLLAGDESLLRQLPAGDWIAGTIPYFMAETGGLCSREKVQATELPDFIAAVDIRSYDAASMSRVYTDAPENGVSFVILPAKSAVHFSFALNAPDYDNFAVRPLLGWVAGTHLDHLGKIPPKVFNGRGPEASEDSAIVMHVSLPKNKIADIGIINIFEQGDGDTIIFPADGFSARDAYVNGRKRNFGEYLFEKNWTNDSPWSPIITVSLSIPASRKAMSCKRRSNSTHRFSAVCPTSTRAPSKTISAASSAKCRRASATRSHFRAIAFSITSTPTWRGKDLPGSQVRPPSARLPINCSIRPWPMSGSSICRPGGNGNGAPFFRQSLNPS
jgi:hypothetical protein